MAGALPGLGQSAHVQGVTRNGFALSPANASAQFRMNTNGFAESAPTSGTFSNEFRWFTGCGTNAQYWCRMTVVSGTFSAGTTGTWLVLSTSRTWSRTRTSDVPGTDTAVGTLEIALDSGGTRIIGSGTITLSAQVDI